MALDTRADADPSGGDGVDRAAADPRSGPAAIEVRGVGKTFRIPTHRISRLKERAVRPFARQEYRMLEALGDVTFDVRRGEFFGIVGRNGSGKSTLLKIMASIYRADAGRVMMAGRLAPFIELGVGFDMELTARDNIVLNGVMMGLTPREARERIDEVLAFAELEEFDEVKLKNYSSGMLVRLGFSVMIQAEADILLIDEVLAVGDAAFQRKCADVFHEMRDEGKTIVLVTHDMAAVEHYCHRAMLLNAGRLESIGEPAEVTKRYLSLNFEQGFQPAQGEAPESDDVRIVDVWLEDDAGERVTNVEQGSQLRIRSLIEAQRPLPAPRVGFVVATPEDVYVHQFKVRLSDGSEAARGLGQGERATVGVDVENQLAPGRYFVHQGVTRTQEPGDTALWQPHALGFVVHGERESAGVVAPEYRTEVRREDR